jgi:hypothetical protein
MPTNHWKAEVLNSRFRSGGKAYVGLSKTTPNEDGSNISEPSGASYERVEINLNTSTFTEPENSTQMIEQEQYNVTSIDNAIDITFREAGEEWSTASAPITNWTLHSAQVGGTLLAYGLLTPSKVIGGSDVFSIPAGRLTIGVINKS